MAHLKFHRWAVGAHTKNISEVSDILHTGIDLIL
jgi:hypothetical protein